MTQLLQDSPPRKRDGPRGLTLEALIKEAHRDQRSFRWVENFFGDLRYGLRSLRRNPAFAATVIGVLGLGIGANSALFCLLDAVLLKPLPYSAPERIVTVWAAPTPTTRNKATTLDFLDWKRLNQSFEALSVKLSTAGTLTGQGEPARWNGHLVSDDFFRVFGVSPLFGRDFSQADTRLGAAPVLILSHSAWRGRFGSDSNILGRKLDLDGEPHQVIGVLSRRGASTGSEASSGNL